MSLLEDIFLRDEADEARELERIIEGDEYDDKPQIRSDSDDDSVKEDEAEEEKQRVDPSSTKTKRSVRNPRVILNPARLTGPRGVQVIPEHFKDFKFKGQGHEKEDLDLVLKKLEHWAYRLYPKFPFEDCLKKIEILGKKRPVMVHLHKIRSDQYSSEEIVVQKDSSDDETTPVEKEEDEFDKLLRQQIELARSTPGPEIIKKTMLESSSTNSYQNYSCSTFTASKATSSPSISDEQRERMMKSRKMAEEKRLARLKTNSIMTNSGAHDKDSVSTFSTKETNKHGEDEDMNKTIKEITVFEENVTVTRKHNRSNIIESSDDEDEMRRVNEQIRVDIHTLVPETNVVQKHLNTYNKNRKFNDSHFSNETENEIVSEKIISLETKIDKKTNQLSINSEACEEPTELADDIQINGGDEVRSADTESPVNEEIEKQNTVTEEKINVGKSDCNKTSECIEAAKITEAIETNESEATKETITTNDDVVKLDDIQGTESRISKTITEVSEDVDDIMDVDFSDDF